MTLKKLIINVLLLTIISIATFIFIGLLVDENNSPADGNDVFGFPLVYYTYSGGKMSVEPEVRTYFNQAYLIIDWLLTVLVSAGLIYGFKKLIDFSKK
jgi:hypothetical protein